MLLLTLGISVRQVMRSRQVFIKFDGMPNCGQLFCLQDINSCLHLGYI